MDARKDGGGAGAQKPRRELAPIKVWVTEAERAAIVADACKTRLSASAYLRRLALGYEPRSMVDLDQVDAVLKVSADAGRVGGLLKMWLTDDERLAEFGRDMRPLIHAALQRIGDTQVKIHAIADRVLKARR